MKKISIILVDLILIFGSVFLSYHVLNAEELIQDYERNIQAFYLISPAIILLYLIFMYSYGLYNASRRKLGDLVYTVFLISISLMIGIMAVCFFVREGALAFPRSVILLSGPFIFSSLLFWRTLIWKGERIRHGIREVVIVGPEAEYLSSLLKEKYKELYRVTYTCEESDSQLPAYIRESDEIFMTSGVTAKGRDKILLTASEKQTSVYFIPEYRDVSVMSASMKKTDDIPTFHIPLLELTMEERFVKRTLDLILSSIAFTIAFPIGLIVACFVKSDGGSIFYSQERLTRDGRVFKVLKFRTMIPNAEKLSGPVLAGENDPRITKVGKFIRATRLDELPQIINILNGDMSIVGPRPERPFFTEQFIQEVPQYSQRLKVKAGLTGLAQVEGKYNTTFENKLRYDLLYIANYSLYRDLLIILQTIKILFVKDSTEGVVKEDKAKEKEFYGSLTTADHKVD